MYVGGANLVPLTEQARWLRPHEIVVRAAVSALTALPRLPHDTVDPQQRVHALAIEPKGRETKINFRDTASKR